MILVTGGAGYIGSHTVYELLKDNMDVIVLDNLSNSSEEALKRVSSLANKQVRFIKGDIRSHDTLLKIFTKNKIDAVIHFAGLKSVSESVSKPLEYYDNNLFGSVQLLRVMSEFNVKNIVFSSSATVYGEPLSLPLKESMPTGIPTNPYGMSKLMIENILDDVFRSDSSYSIVKLRYFNPVGADFSGNIGENPKGIPNNLMPYICQTASGQLSELEVFGCDYNTLDGSGVRDYIHVSDLAEGHLYALKNCLNKKGNDIYNLGTGEGTSVLQLIKAFEKTNNIKVNYKTSQRRQGDIAKSYADVSKIKEELGWEASRGINQMCEDAWRWQNINPNGYNAK